MAGWSHFLAFVNMYRLPIPIPEFKYLVYLFFDLLFMCMFIGYQILTLSKNNIYHFYIGFALYLIANLTLNSFYSVF